MADLQIENPTFTISYQLSWEQIKGHVLKVVSTFPSEYTIIKNDETQNKITVLNIPISVANKAITKDQIIYCSGTRNYDTSITLLIEITNEDSKIASYTELERDKKSLNTFRILLQKSVDNTLGKTVANINAKAKQANNSQGILQLLLLLAALVAVFFGLKGLFS